MSTVGSAFRAWVLAQSVCGTEPVATGGDAFRIETPSATAEVNIYPFDDGTEIVEYRIVRAADGEQTFFLHALLDDLGRAEELFHQMAEALEEARTHKTTHVLLCCTSGLTTSLFAARIGEAAKALSLDYDFTAMSESQALKAEGFEAVLLAPQVAYLRKQMMKAHPNAIVFEIPGKVFGSYDGGEAVRLLMQALRDVPAQEGAMRSLLPTRSLDGDRRVLAITLFSVRDYALLGYRMYDHGVVVDRGSVQKPRLDFRDIADLIETISVGKVDLADIDAIGLAVPGVTCRGLVTLPNVFEGEYDLGRALAQRFGLPVYVDNNCNAAAVGCYVSQEEYESLIFFRQAFGHEAGGFGTIIDGRLLKGRGNLAGEPKHFVRRFDFVPNYDEARWSARGMHRIAEDIVLAGISLISPEAVYLAVDTVDDAEEFRASLAEELGWRYVPPVHIVNDYVERVYLGVWALALQKLRNPYYRSLGVGVWEGLQPRANERREEAPEAAV